MNIETQETHYDWVSVTVEVSNGASISNDIDIIDAPKFSEDLAACLNAMFKLCEMEGSEIVEFIKDQGLLPNYYKIVEED